MQYSSHRVKIEEKRLFNRLVKSLFFLVVLFFVVIFFGIPFLVKILIFFTSLKKDTVKPADVVDSIILPPVINSLFEATNSSPIIVTGFSEKGSKVKIIVNGKEAATVYADAEGRFIADKVKLQEGINEITAVAVRNDKESTFSSFLTIEYKKSSPKLEIDSPKENEKRFFENRELEIIGVTDEGNRVTINERLVIVDSHGRFRYRVVLHEGENIFKIKAEDKAGNITEIERKVIYSP